MKKSILFLIAVLPLVASCNKNSKGFVDPFPNDPYESEKIGFGFDSDEKIKRTLTTQESEALDNTLANLTSLNPLITQEKNSEIHIRDYTRAFAGVHGQGYGSYNMMYDEENINSFYQEANGAYHRRRETNSSVKSLYDYDYGQNSIETKYKTIRYLAKDAGDPNHYAETTVTGTDYTHAIERKYEIVNETQESTDITVSASIIADSKKGAEEALYFDQSEYIFKPSASDPVAGAYDDNHIIIIREQHDPSGEYELPDGRKYKSAKNTLKVTRLVKNNALGDDYYIVEKSRTYTETAITSDVIQPNVPISFLKNPIVIKYQEDIHRFSTSVVTDESTKYIDEVEIKQWISV